MVEVLIDCIAVREHNVVYPLNSHKVMTGAGARMQGYGRVPACAHMGYYTLVDGVVAPECVAESSGGMGKWIGVIMMVSTSLAFISSSRDRRRVNIFALSCN